MTDAQIEEVRAIVREELERRKREERRVQDQGFAALLAMIGGEPTVGTVDRG